VADRAAAGSCAWRLHPVDLASGCRLGFPWLVLVIGLFEEAIGRWLFYARRNPGI